MTKFVTAFALFLIIAMPSWAFRPQDDAANSRLFIPYYDDQPAFLSALSPVPFDDPEWNAFVRQNGAWAATMNNLTGMIHRAWGGSIFVGVPADDQSATEIALDFLRRFQDVTRVPTEDLAQVLSRHRGHHWFVHFKQQYQGLDIYGSMISVRISDRGNVVLFECGYFPGLDITTAPALSKEAAASLASSGLIGFQGSNDPDLLIFPVPADEQFEFRLAYMTEVSTDERGRYLTIVDASTGELLYRKNLVHYVTVDGFVDGSIFPATPFDSLVIMPFQYETVNVGGLSPTQTDINGFFTAEAPDMQRRSLNTRLIGSFVNVLNSQGSESSLADSVAPGETLMVAWDILNSRGDERTSYYHTNIIHDYMSAIDPGFTDLDFPLTCNVNIFDYCNAYWDGSSINFFQIGNGCSNTGEIADVIYHEYGHGVTDFQYRPSSPSGAQHEGWSDFIAATITNQPLIGRGFYLTGPDDYLRTVDNSNRYPEDWIGESHNDGLIVAGALWDLREALSPRTGYCDSLFHYGRYGLSNNYNDYLVDILTYDDDDDNLFNGTPTWNLIVPAFDLHGIVLPPLAIIHQPLEDTFSEDPYPVFVTVTISSTPIDDDSAFVLYRTATADPFTSVALSPTANPGEFSGVIPGQSQGTLIEYYFSLYDIAGTEHRSPITAPVPTYFFVVGQLAIHLADSLEHISGWTVGAPGDDAPRGIWVRVDPNGTYADADPNYPYQPEDDHTPDPATYCYVTGQHPLGEPNNGFADVDSGRTTLNSPTYDLSSIGSPVVEYYRWFTTNRNVEDTFYVNISSDGGANWLPLEILTVTENFWKKSRFLISQIFSQFNQVRLQFIAVDEGTGSLVEAAVDDITIYAAQPTAIRESDILPAEFALRQNYPNPFNGRTEISFTLAVPSDVNLSVFDIAGRLVSAQTFAGLDAGHHTIHWDSRLPDGSELPSGIYLYKLQAGDRSDTRKMALVK
jgi:hypothetical protein